MTPALCRCPRISWNGAGSLPCSIALVCQRIAASVAAFTEASACLICSALMPLQSTDSLRTGGRQTLVSLASGPLQMLACWLARLGRLLDSASYTDRSATQLCRTSVSLLNPTRHQATLPLIPGKGGERAMPAQNRNTTPAANLKLWDSAPSLNPRM